MGEGTTLLREITLEKNNASILVPTFNWVFVTNSVRNINTAKSLQNRRKQFAMRRKKSPTLDTGSYLEYISIPINFTCQY